MAREHLSARANWQQFANEVGSDREDLVFLVLKKLLEGDRVCEVVKSNTVALYPNGRGIRPDCVVRNKTNNKMLLVEVKRQGSGGNAHERLCRNYMLGIQDGLEKECGFRYPVFTVCTNGLANDDHKSQEIKKWFEHDDIKDRLFLWEDTSRPELIAGYFQQVIARYLGYEV